MTAWIRLRWTAPIFACCDPTTGAFVDITSQTIRSIFILFDEGQDTGPDEFGLAVLDNIDVNGTLVGRGPST